MTPARMRTASRRRGCRLGLLTRPEALVIDKKYRAPRRAWTEEEMKSRSPPLLIAVLLIPLVGCGSRETGTATDYAPASANGALIATETTCCGFRARFALVPDLAITDRAPDAPVVRGLRWTVEVAPPGTVSSPPILSMESFTVRGTAGEHRSLGSSPPTSTTPPWRWSGPVGITDLAGGFRRGDHVNLFPGFPGGIGPSLAWLGIDLVPAGGGVVAEAPRIVKPAPCPAP